MPPSLKLSRRREALPPSEPELDPVEDGHELRMSLLEHLDELRQRLLKAAIGLIVGTAVGVLFANQAYQFLLAPYGQRLQIIDPTGSVTNFFRVALLIGAILAIPMITYQVMAFVLPGLTRRERRVVFMALPAITLLFVVGATFSWYLLIPPALNFLAEFQADIFFVEWTADGYLGFVTSLIFWMGVAFETPLVFFVFAFLGFVTPRALIKNWRFAIIGAAAAAAFITPTIDPVNMFLVMAPLLVLYLLSILMVAVGNRVGKVKPA